MSAANRYAVVVRAFGGKGLPESMFLAPLQGRTLVALAIEHALASRKAGSVIVCTGFESVAAAAARERVTAVLASPEDAADPLAAVLRALERDTTGGMAPTAAVVIRPEFPLRARDGIDTAITRFEAEHADFMISACEIGGFVWRSGPGKLRRNSRMDASSLIREVRSTIVVRMDTLRRIVETGSPETDDIAAHRISFLESFEVRNAEDLAVAGKILEIRGNAVTPSPLSGIRLLVLDFDGVMTDNRVLTAQDGTEAVFCSRSDGMGVGLLRHAGVDVMVLSTEENPVVSARCNKLKIPCIQGSKDKLAALKGEAGRRGLKQSEIAFVGNDVNDVEVMRWVGTGIAVADAYPEPLAVASMVTTRPGGSGAVREVVDWILEARGCK